MITALMLISIPVVLIITCIKPKWGSLLIWPILFAYPHGWWFEHQYLPLNIGFDDLFCIFLFLVVLIRRNLLGPVRVRFGYAFWVITAFAVIVAIANFAGSRDVYRLERAPFFKDVLKAGVYWCLFYAILHCIDNERDLKIQLTFFSMAAVLGAVIIIVQRFFPYQMEGFLSPTWFEERGLPFGRRAAGAFLNSNAAGNVLACSLAFVIVTIRLQKRFISKAITFSFVAILFIAILMTGSRSGLISLAGMLAIMGLVGQHKKLAWLAIVAAVVVAVALPVARQAYQRRVLVAYEPTTGMWGRSVVGRFATWRGYFETATAKDYLLGQGHRKGIIQSGTESHSTYVSLITVYGIGGVIWAAVALIIFFRKAFGLRHFPDPFILAISAGCVWALIAWGIYSLAADAISSPYSRYLLFYIVVLMDRAYYIALAGQQQELPLYAEQAEQLEMQYAGVESY